MNLQTAINQHFKKLNDNENSVLSYIEAHKKSCSTMSISSLSKATNVSNSFIMRLSQKLGYTGYSEMKYQLKSELEMEKSAAVEFDILTSFKNDIEETFRLMNSETFKKIPELLLNAPHIYTFGSGYGQQTILEDFKRGMVHCNRFVLSIPSSHELRLNAKVMVKGDVLFVVSMSGHVPSIEKELHTLVLNGVAVVGISLFKTNTLASVASHNLYIQSTPILVQQEKESYTSYATLSILLDALVKHYLIHQHQQNLC